MAALATMAADTRTPATIRVGRTRIGVTGRREGITRIRIGITRPLTATRTTRQRMATTRRWLQQCSAAWVSSATTMA
jgi:hypothetical protein